MKVVNWFIRKQESDGKWSAATEDTASSVLGLYYLLNELESTSISKTQCDAAIFTALRMNLATPALRMNRMLIEKYEDGTISINFRFSRRDKKIAASVLAILSVAGTVFGFWGPIRGLLSFILGLLGFK